ncbi:hypothetical protein WAI453_004544 [Rhynchosporium graminicola]|uniref:Related to campothecin resistance conferring protein n=1 Tax=Rhynchosporium graminicola TaxID=2792576 RepID=A0A1E1LLT9_9HELO|nr:related to campothecin resistance conferring protein [Rhynchosporium commune]
MWVFSCDGDVLKGKRLWIRPGKTVLIGRTAAEEGQFVVSDKTISRKHLTVKLANVKPSDYANANYRTKLTIQDGCGDPKGTKIGTLLNGAQIRGQTKTLELDENTVVLGKYKHNFRFTWIPMALTFTFSTKERKANPYPALYDRLGPLDIRVLVDYEREHTTHVVARKRNTSKGLQALINGKYIVYHDTFIEALVVATTSEEIDCPAPLELDFDSHFPDPLQHLPPRGEEPTERGAEAYSPSPSRLDMFEGYTFVFYEKQQHENLLRPISEGGGKVSLREVVPDQTTVDEFVIYVKGVAGEKGLGEFEDGSEGKGVVVVKYNPSKGAGTEWWAEFNRQIALVLDHRLIEQNEFLDAILGNDAGVLRRPLLNEDPGLVAPPPSFVTVAESQTNQNQEGESAPEPMAPPEPPTRRGRRRPAKAVVEFEDEFLGPINSSMPQPESMQVDQPVAEFEQSQGLFLTQDPDQILEVPKSPAQETSRKRIFSPAFEEEEDIMEEAAPRAAALKRRRLANEAEKNLRRGATPSPRASATPAPEPVAVAKVEPTPKGRGKKIKKEKEVDIIEVRRQEREKAEAAARAERESVPEDMSGIDLEQIRKLVIIETMPVRKPNSYIQRTERPEDSERWDEKWNARVNHKKFNRRPGAAAVRGLRKVIVPLEEAKKRDYGIGDTYWEDDSQHKKKGKGKGKETQEFSQKDTQPKQRSGAAEAASRFLASEVEEHAGAESESDLEIVAPKGRTGRISDKLVDKTSASQNLKTNKRPAATTLTKAAPAKKARPAPARKPVVEPDSDEDSDDGLKFKFKKKA